MDSQHRHELQENELAHWLERQIEAYKPHLPAILGGVVVVAIAIWGLNLYRSSSASANYASWDGYAIAMEGQQPNLALLEQVSIDHTGTAAGEWADITLADGKLYVAAQSYLANRDSANLSLDEAKELYQRLRGASDARVRNRATFGLSRAAEIEGDLEEATNLYGQVSGAFQSLAEKRAEELAVERTASDFEWLATAKVARSRPPAGPGIPGQVPDFAADIINTPSGDEAESGPAIDLPTGDESIADLLKNIDDQDEANQEAAAEATAESADLQPADESATDKGDGAE